MGTMGILDLEIIIRPSQVRVGWKTVPVGLCSLVPLNGRGWRLMTGMVVQRKSKQTFLCRRNWVSARDDGIQYNN